jgi:hypothetical protein
MTQNNKARIKQKNTGEIRYWLFSSAITIMSCPCVICQKAKRANSKKRMEGKKSQIAFNIYRQVAGIRISL